MATSRVGAGAVLHGQSERAHVVTCQSGQMLSLASGCWADVVLKGPSGVAQHDVALHGQAAWLITSTLATALELSQNYYIYSPELTAWFVITLVLGSLWLGIVQSFK